MSRPQAPVEFRVVEKIELCNEGCWLWTGKLNKTGYGTLQVGGHRGKYRLAHRLVYEMIEGEIPDGLTLDHLCRVTRCVNPDHLEPVSNKTNVLRGSGFAAVNAAKTHCSNGHAFTPDNTVFYNGWRRCRTCRKRVLVENRQRNKQAPRRTVDDVAAERTHCRNGHEINRVNTRVNSDNSWQCRVCDAERARQKRTLNRERKR